VGVCSGINPIPTNRPTANVRGKFTSGKDATFMLWYALFCLHLKHLWECPSKAWVAEGESFWAAPMALLSMDRLLMWPDMYYQDFLLPLGASDIEIEFDRMAFGSNAIRFRTRSPVMSGTPVVSY
jgi:hypothetical protein